MEVPTEEAWPTQMTTIQISEIPNAASRNLEVPGVSTSNTTLEVPRILEPCYVELSNAGVASTHTASASANLERPEDAQRSPSAYAPPTSRHGRRGNIGQRRRNLTPFERATSEFVHIEERRLHLEEMRIIREHEREMARIRAEYQINEILQKIADNIERWLMRDTT